MLTEEQINKLTTKEKLLIASNFMKEVIRESRIQNKQKITFLLKRLNDLFKHIKPINHIEIKQEVKADDDTNK